MLKNFRKQKYLIYSYNFNEFQIKNYENQTSGNTQAGYPVKSATGLFNLLKGNYIFKA